MGHVDYLHVNRQLRKEETELNVFDRFGQVFPGLLRVLRGDPRLLERFDCAGNGQNVILRLFKLDEKV